MAEQHTPSPLTVSELVEMAKGWWALRVPIYVDIEGHEMKLAYRYCDSRGLHLTIVPAERD